MKGKVFLVEWDPKAAEARASSLRREGFRVDVESENGGRAYRAIRTSIPDVVVLDLRRKASHGREVGGALRALTATRAVPIVCIEDGVDAREATRIMIPDAMFVGDDAELAGSIGEATRRAPPPRAAKSLRKLP